MADYYVVYYHVLAISRAQIDGPDSFRGRKYKKTWTRRFESLKEVDTFTEGLMNGKLPMSPTGWKILEVIDFSVVEVQETTLIRCHKVTK